MPLHVLGCDPFPLLAVYGVGAGFHAGGGFHHVAACIKLGIVRHDGILAHYVGIGLIGGSMAVDLKKGDLPTG